MIAYSVGSLLGMRDLRAGARTVGWLVVCSVIAVVACSAVVLPLLLPCAVDQGLFVAVVSLTLGSQVILSSFFLSILALKRR